MPAAKKATRRSTKRPAQKRTRKATMSADHKRKLAEGRSMSATVDQYVTIVNTPKMRGRHVSLATLTSRLAAAQTDVKNGSGVAKLVAAQTVRDLTAQVARARAATNGHERTAAERDFIKIAKQFSANRRISYGAWRDAGVPADVLRKAGIARTRG